MASLTLRLIFAGVFALIGFIFSMKSLEKLDISLIIGVVLFIGLMFLTSESFKRWDKARVERHKRYTEIHNTARAWESGRIRAREAAAVGRTMTRDALSAKGVRRRIKDHFGY